MMMVGTTNTTTAAMATRRHGKAPQRRARQWRGAWHAKCSRGHQMPSLFLFACCTTVAANMRRRLPPYRTVTGYEACASLPQNEPSRRTERYFSIPRAAISSSANCASVIGAAKDCIASSCTSVRQRGYFEKELPRRKRFLLGEKGS
jgi:hypothetical protein